MNAIDNQTGLQ